MHSLSDWLTVAPIECVMCFVAKIEKCDVISLQGNHHSTHVSLKWIMNLTVHDEIYFNTEYVAYDVVSQWQEWPII